MKRIRQGNDFLVTWRIKRAGINEDLTQAVNMSLVASVKSDGLIHSKIVPFDIVDNSIVRIEVTPQIAQWEGIYNFVLKYEFDYPSYADNNEKVAVDKNMFIIVSRTAQADEITIIECESDVLIGLKGEKGDSAFTVWNKENGGNNTYDDWLAFLQSPATEIEGIVSANEAIRIENENTRKLNEIERKQSEETRLQNESARVTAEIDREENEDTRSLNEATRLTNEDDRIANENQRVIDEEKREQLYDNTVILKGEVETLKTETETAKDNAITATNQINTVVIPNAETAIQNAIDVKTDYETVVKPDVIAKAAYAETQGNYAKEQGEAVDGRISEVEGKIGYSLGWYGIEFDETIANSACTRIGEMDLHRRLPIQNQMRRCLLLDNGKVNYYLHKDDSTKKADGTDAVLDGTDGQVMVEIPAHWRRFEKDGTVHRVKISDFKLEGFHFVPKAYRSAYEATVERSSLKLSSVVNMDVDFRGGNNNASLDGASNSLLGRPAAAISGTNFALYAKNRGDRWCMDVYHVKKAMDWLYYIEYANFNSQLPFNPTLTAEGFKQGGLGDGVTDLNSTKWDEFNGRYPFIPMGYTNSLGNKTGVKPFDMPAEYDEDIFTTNVPSYRGIENPFGHIWKWADGLKINIQADDAGGESQMFVCEDPLLFQHSNYDGYEKRGLLPRANGYISKMIMGEFGELMPKEAVGGSTTYFADYFYTSIPNSGESQRGVLFGGGASIGTRAGLAYSHSTNAFSSTDTHFGSRLCFLP